MEWYKKSFSISDLVDRVNFFKEKNIKRDLQKFLPKNYRPFLKELKVKTLAKLDLMMHG
ncbi:MAG: hypothetical protein HYS07_03040 [Chlamydiae bacterium]|nr:hypothetical protein [Chlamydiota bacterium]MBI3277183.1 hypothetical protein [Chlamydiota bacterium]